MGDAILRTWINDEIGLSRPVDVFESDFANGYLLGEVLYRHGLIDSIDGLRDAETTSAKINNFRIIQQPLTDLGVKFDSRLANAVMTGRPNIATNLCYQLKIALDNAKQGGPRAGTPAADANRSGSLAKSTIKSNRQTLAKHETMQQQHFESMVMQSAQNPKELRETLTLSKYADFMMEQTKRAEEFEEMSMQQHGEANAQRRQLQLSKMAASRAAMDDWQAEGYRKHRQNLAQRSEAERAALRFELTTRERKLSAQMAAKQRAAADQQDGIDAFEQTLKWLANDAPAEAEAAPHIAFSESAAEHLARLERKLPNPKKMEADAAAYIERLKSRKAEEEASRKERELRRRKVMLEQASAQAALEERRRDELLLAKLSKQCAEEKKIAGQLWQAAQEKEVMRENRLLRERQYEERRRLDAAERIERERELGARARQEYAQTVALERQRAAEAAAAAAAAKRAKHEAFCRTVAEQLVDLAGKVSGFRASTQSLLPPKVYREWLALFAAGVVDDKPTTDADADADAQGETLADKESPVEALLHEREIDDYLCARADWDPRALGTVRLPAETSEMVESLVESDKEQGCAVTGRMVLELIAAAAPPPPPRPTVDLSLSLLKLALVGKPFGGKSIQAQQLANEYGLQVISAQEQLHLAITAASRAPLTDDEIDGAEANAAAAASPSEMRVLGARAAALLKEGAAVPDDILVGVVVCAMRAADPVSYNGVVLDGFPRTRAQAQLLEKSLSGYDPQEAAAAKPKGSKVAPAPANAVPEPTRPPPALDLVLCIDIADETARQRALGRRLDPLTGTVYHLELEPPPEEPGLIERLVPLTSASNQEANLSTSLAAYAAQESALAEWLGTELNILRKVDGQGSMQQVAEALAAEVVSAFETKKAQVAKLAAEADAKEAAEAAAKEAAEATEAEAAEAAKLAEEGEEQGLASAPAAPAAAPPPGPPKLEGELSQMVLAQWSSVEDDFVTQLKKSLGQVRELQLRGLQRVSSTRAAFYDLLRAPDARQDLVVATQEKFNALPTELRYTESGKAELHMLVEEMQEGLWSLSDEKRQRAEERLAAWASDGWTAQQALLLVLALLEAAQAEADRFCGSCAVLQMYASLRCGTQLALPPPGLPESAQLPVPEAVLFTMAADDVDAEAPAAAPATAGKKAAGKEAGKDAGKGTKKGADHEPVEAELALANALADFIKTHCEVSSGAGSASNPESFVSQQGAELLVAKWTANLAQAIDGERAKLRRRLSAIACYGCQMLSELRSQTKDLFALLDGWLGARIRNESAAVSALAKQMRAAIEAEDPLPHALALQGDVLVIDETLLLLPQPPPPPPPPPEVLVAGDTFSLSQLRDLAAKLRALSAGFLISSDKLVEMFCRLSTTAFDVASPPLPPPWRPLGASAYAQLAALFASDDSQVPWPELVVSLSPASRPSAEQAVALLRAAAAVARRTDLLEAPTAGADADADVDAEKVKPAPLLLTREQYDSLSFWFEGAETGASVDGESTLNLKSLLFSMLAIQGTLDVQRLLLYFCDDAAKAFAVSGFCSGGLLSLEQLYATLHRDAPAAPPLQAPAHADAMSREVLARLWEELKLDDAQRVSHSMVAQHPLGANLLAACRAYTRKDAYGLVASLHEQANKALKI